MTSLGEQMTSLETLLKNLTPTHLDPDHPALQLGPWQEWSGSAPGWVRKSVATGEDVLVVYENREMRSRSAAIRYGGSEWQISDYLPIFDDGDGTSEADKWWAEIFGAHKAVEAAIEAQLSGGAKALQLIANRAFKAAIQRGQYDGDPTDEELVGQIQRESAAIPADDRDKAEQKIMACIVQYLATLRYWRADIAALAKAELKNVGARQ